MRKAVFCLLLAGLVIPATLFGAVQVKPYGFVLLNASYNTDAVTDIPVVAPMEDTGEGNFVITPRQTRFGLKMTSDAKYTPSGGIEVDFWGLRGSGSNGGPTQSAPRLRRAFLELHFDSFNLLVGQEWIVFAPLSPTTIMHVSLPGLMASGNLWARLPQIRGTFQPSDEVKLQLALTRPLGADATMTPVAQGDVFGAGERSEMPWVQGRIGYSMKGETSLCLGVSGHFGMEDFGQDPQGDDITATSYAVAGDVRLKTGPVTVSGEGFYGQNLKTLFSTATFARVTDLSGALTDINEIQTMGGWGEVKFAATPELNLAACAGIEAVDDEYLADGMIKQNLTVLGNAVYTLTDGVKVGVELGYINTERIQDDPATTAKETDDGGSNVNGNLSFMFSF